MTASARRASAPSVADAAHEDNRRATPPRIPNDQTHIESKAAGLASIHPRSPAKPAYRRVQVPRHTSTPQTSGTKPKRRRPQRNSHRIPRAWRPRAAAAGAGRAGPRPYTRQGPTTAIPVTSAPAHWESRWRDSATQASAVRPSDRVQGDPAANRPQRVSQSRRNSRPQCG